MDARKLSFVYLQGKAFAIEKGLFKSPMQASAMVQEGGTQGMNLQQTQQLLINPAMREHSVQLPPHFRMRRIKELEQISDSSNQSMCYYAGNPPDSIEQPMASESQRQNTDSDGDVSRLTKPGRVSKGSKGARIWKCKTCPRTYTREVHLLRHEELHPSGMGPSESEHPEFATVVDHIAPAERLDDRSPTTVISTIAECAVAEPPEARNELFVNSRYKSLPLDQARGIETASESRPRKARAKRSRQDISDFVEFNDKAKRKRTWHGPEVPSCIVEPMQEVSADGPWAMDQVDELVKRWTTINV